MPISYAKRAKLCQNSIAKKLLTLIDSKQTNLCVSADVTTASELLALAEQVGPEICLLKTHVDIITDFTPTLTKRLRELAETHQFLLFEDRKFADIGNTVLHQFRDGIYHIAKWADIINAHILPGAGIIQGLQQGNQSGGLLLLAQMSSKGNYLNDAYTQAAIELAEQHSDFVMGFICQEKLSDNPSLIHMTPGVKLTANTDDLGQQYNSPDYTIKEKGTDVIIVGRGIYQADSPQKSAATYREQAWAAYQQRC